MVSLERKRSFWGKRMAHALHKGDYIAPSNTSVNGGKAGMRSTSPSNPPSPDLSHLTAEELSILSRVFKKEERFEIQEKERLRNIKERLEKYEEAVRKHANAKGKLKHIDLRLCRLCFKTKFADGIGRVCHDCRKRVCLRCGSFTSSKWNARKYKSVRGRWRCNLCLMRRELVCQSGAWFYGNELSPLPRRKSLRDQLLFLDLDSSDSDIQTRSDDSSSSSYLSVSETYTDADLNNSVAARRKDSMNYHPKTKQRENSHQSIPGGHSRTRRRSVTVIQRSSPSGNNDDDSDETDAADERDRQRTYMKPKRYHGQRRNSRRNIKPRHQSPDLRESVSSNLSSDYPREFIMNGAQICSSPEHAPPMQHLNVDDRNYERRRHSAESVRSGTVSVFFKPDDSQTDESRKSSLTQVSVKSYGDRSNSSALQWGTWNNNDVDSPSHLSAGTGPVHRLSMPGLSTHRSSIPKVPEFRRHSNPRPRNSRSSSLDTDQHEEAGARYLKKTHLMPPDTSSGVRRWSSDSGSSRRSSGHTEIDSADGNESFKIQNVFSETDLTSGWTTTGYYDSLKRRELLLYRDETTQDVRGNGLGMRVVGGLRRYGRKLGAFVMSVEAEGPADSYGIVKGDQILIWNGKSLMDTSFEETNDIMQQPSEIVQLVIVHHEQSVDDVDKTETADETEDTSLNPPNTLNLNKPKRRMLPKTPIEMKKEERQVSGKIKMNMSYSEEDECFSFTLINATDLRIPGQTLITTVNPVALIYLLPGRGACPPYETIPQFNTNNPSWNETYNLRDIPANEIKKKSLEVTLWSQQQTGDEFLGEILLDLEDANLSHEIITFDLQDHDENSSPLPSRNRKESLSDVTTTSQISPLTSTVDTSSNWSTSPCHVSNQTLQSGERSRHGSFDPFISERPSTIHGKTSRERLSLMGSISSVSTQSPTTTLRKNDSSVDGCKLHRMDSFSTKMKRKMATAVSKVSSQLIGDRRTSLQEECLTNRSHSEEDVIGSLLPSHHCHPKDYTGARLSDVSSLPRPCSDTPGSAYGDTTDNDDLDRSLGFATPDRPAPEGDDITSMLGPSQLPPKPASEQSVCGDIKLGFMVSKGQLEIDVICVTGLLKDSENFPPDTYVKTYLVGGTKVIQKKKTPIVRSSYEPAFRKKIKYSACNIHGRSIKVIVWAKQGAFDKKLCLGEAVIQLDGLDLCQHTLSWYKLFPQGATDFSSNESISF